MEWLLPLSIIVGSLILGAAAIVVARIVAASKQQQAPPTGFPSLGNMPLLEFPQSPQGAPVEPTDIPVNADDVDIGTRVLSYSQGRWWRAEVISRVSRDQVRIHYLGWDSKWDAVVPIDELQVDLGT